MKPQINIGLTMLVAAFAVSSASLGFAQQAGTTDIGTLDKESADQAFKQRPYSPYAGRTFPTRPLFGDTHLHTSFSMDAGAFGARLGPKEAYRFAKGEEVTRPAASRPNSRDRSISSWSPITQTALVSFRSCSGATRRCSLTRRAAAGMT